MSEQALSLPQMEALRQELSPQILDYTVVKCACSNPQRLFLYLKKETRRRALFLCLEKPFLRFHLIQSSDKEKETKHELSHYLEGWRLTAIELLNEDRILQLEFQRQGQTLRLIVEFFPKHPNYHLIGDDKKILLSLYPINQAIYTIPSQPRFSTNLSRPILSQKKLEDLYLEKEQAFHFQQEKERASRRIERLIKGQEKRKQRTGQEFEQAKKWETMQWEGELLKASYSSLKKGLTALTVWDWLAEKERVIPLYPRLSPQEQISQRFRQSKKFQKSLPYLEDQKQKIDQEIKRLIDELANLQSIQTNEELEIIKQSYSPALISPFAPIKPVAKSVSLLPYYEYRSINGFKIWVGRNARANEKLTFQLANGSDWWLHAQDYPGSHVIIRLNKKEEPDSETLLDAMQLALHYSKAKSKGEAEICISQRKFVSRLSKSSIGKVQISKHKRLFVRLDERRLQRLKEQRVPLDTNRAI